MRDSYSRRLCLYKSCTSIPEPLEVIAILPVKYRNEKKMADQSYKTF